MRKFEDWKSVSWRFAFVCKASLLSYNKQWELASFLIRLVVCFGSIFIYLFSLLKLVWLFARAQTYVTNYCGKRSQIRMIIQTCVTFVRHIHRVQVEVRQQSISIRPSGRADRPMDGYKNFLPRLDDSAIFSLLRFEWPRTVRVGMSAKLFLSFLLHSLVKHCIAK